MVFPGYARPSGPDPVNPQDLATKNYIDRVPYARYYRDAALTFVAGTPVNPFVYNHQGTGSDPSLNYSPGGVYTVPISGLYFVRAAVSVGATASGQSLTVYWYWNGNQNLTVNGFVTAASALAVECSGVINVSAGDTLQVAAQSSAAIPIRAISQETNMQICRIGAIPT